MPIKIYNTKTRKKAELQPLIAGHVKMYVCGITAYDYCHIGHARSALAFDMIYRYLQYRGYQVTYVRNYTDIDDKIINRAAEQNTSTVELAERFILAFNEDMDKLGVAQPTIEPRATEHVQDIVQLIQELMDKGFAYQVNGDVYYTVDRFDNYGALSGRSLDEMLAGARVSINEEKNNPMDFALWKSSKPGEPIWDSPWGPGRPGWHIECSAMSRNFLGNTFDIHGGGKDLIFPHHENEIAQSEAASGEEFARVWIHHGFVNIKDEKMSKSLGNFLTIREVLDKYHPEVLRLFIFSTHYRNPLDYSPDAMQDAEAGLDRIYSCLAELERLGTQPGANGQQPVATKKDVQKIESLAERFKEVMDNDFNTAQALGQIFDSVKVMNKIVHSLSAIPAQYDLDLLKSAGASIRELGSILGMFTQDPVAYIEAKQAKLLEGLDIERKTIENLIKERSEARLEKNWARSDEIRDQLLAKNIELMDGPEGTTWSVQTMKG